jgi:hypothetical protein
MTVTIVRRAFAVVRVWRRPLVVLCAAVGCLLLWSAPALAAGPPLVEGESFSDVGSGSAQLSGKVNAEESPTEYFFEYGVTTAYGAATPAVSVGAGGEAVAVRTTLNGLTPAGEYHFRLVARNASGETTAGLDVTFHTLPQGILGLPDGRVLERVTPVENENADVYVPDAFGGYALPLGEGFPTQRPIRAAADGGAIVYVGDPTSGGVGRGGGGGGNNYLATRSASGGWTQVNLQPPGYFFGEYQSFSSDLSVGFISSPSEDALDKGPPLAPQAPGAYHVLYARNNSDGSYDPFFTTRPPNQTAPEFGFPADYPHEAGPPLYAGSSENLGESLFEANDALTANALYGGPQSAEPQGLQSVNLYVSADGRLSAVNVLPGEQAARPNATFGGMPQPQISAENEAFRGDFSHAISDDGSRIFWTDFNTGDLYVREDPLASDARTVQVDAAVGGGGAFWTASADGSKVFFTKGQLYEYDVESAQTIDLTPGVEVRGVIGASENGEYVYYVDSAYELELWHDGSTTSIATLSETDGERTAPFHVFASEPEPSDWRAEIGYRSAEVTPDGQGLVFMSNQSLRAVGYPNGYDNDGFYEVYVYEAGTGQLFCVSCSRSGEPPQSTEATEAGRNSAAYVPLSFSSTYQLRWASDGGGRVFFDSLEPLVAQDTNGKQDVYEWERDGVGSCREAAGCVYLLSGGTGGSASWLLDASSSGEDVFIASRTELVPGDPYDSFDVYDARVGGVQPPTAPACSGTGCQGVPPAPPIFATPASVTFGGVGNFPPPSPAATKGAGKAHRAKPSMHAQRLARALKACRNERRGKRRAVCEAQARSRDGVRAAARRSGAGRSASKGRV